MMRRVSDLALHDLELLSAYLDGELTPREADRLQARLDGEADLRWALEELRRTVSVVRSLPEVRPPRSFTLSAEAAGSRGRAAAYPILQLATALATLAFVAVVGLDALTSRATGVALAPEFRDQGQLLTAAPVEEAVQAPTSEPAQALSASAPEEPPAASHIHVVGPPQPKPRPRRRPRRRSSAVSQRLPIRQMRLRHSPRRRPGPGPPLPLFAWLRSG